MLEVSGLQKAYGSLVAVDGISFSVPRGIAFGLLGPNGAGKSTTLLMLLGVLRPDRGSIAYAGGRDPVDPRTRRMLGFAPQSLSLYEELTAEENLRFLAELFGVPAAERVGRVRHALEFAGLTDRRNSRVDTYSGGMKRRLNLACAMVHDPDVILMDEPTVGVDPQSRNHIFTQIESLKRQGKTILYTTHYMEEAERLCDQVAIMDHGRLLALDTVPELIRRFGQASIVEGELRDPPRDPSSLPGTLNGNHLRVETNNPLEEVAKLLGREHTFRTLQITSPNLESVFLGLTGRQLRDEAS